MPADVKQPQLDVNHPDHGPELQEALKPSIISDISGAKRAGWESDAIGSALRSFVANLEWAEQENRLTSKAIVTFKSGLTRRI